MKASKLVGLVKEKINSQSATPMRILTLIAAFIIVIMVLSNAGSIIEINESGFTQVKQSWWTGNLSVRFDPGVYLQGLGQIWTYKKESTYKFTSDYQEEGDSDTQGIPVRFNDGGKGVIWGSVRYTMPSSDQEMIEITRLFMNNQDDPFEAFFEQAVLPVVEKALVLSAALVSTEQSYTTHRAQFSQYAWDQIVNGPYVLDERVSTVYDSTRDKWIVEVIPIIALDSLGMPLREESYFRDLGVTLSQFTIVDIDYEEEIDDLIMTSRDFQTRIQTAQADAEKAEQDRITAEETGRRDVSEAEYKAREQKILAVTEAEKNKAKALVDAKRDLAVAQQDYEASQDQVAGMVALARGQAEARRRILAADGALVKKREAYERIMAFWRDAIASQDLVPKVTVMPGNSNRNTDTMMPPGYLLLEQISDEVQRDLGLNFNFPK